MKTASTSTATSLTPDPSPRGEGSDMPCALTACYWLTCQLGNWLTRQLGNWLTRQLPNHSSTYQELVHLLTGSLVHSPTHILLSTFQQIF